MRVAVYARVSTSRQVQLQSIEQQLDRLNGHIQAQWWELSEENIFRDDGYSGATLTRPGLDKLRDKARGRELDLALLTAPDRLARNYVHQMVIMEELESYGCRVEFLDRPMSQDPNDRLLLEIRGAVAEYERTLITERMRRGKLSKFKAGLLLPWVNVPYGYRVDPDRPRDPQGVRLDEYEASVVKQIFAWYLEHGTSLKQVSRRLKDSGAPSPTGRRVWGLPTLRGILTNPTYTGQVYTGRTHYRPPQIRRSATHPIGRSHSTAVPVPSEEWVLVATVPTIVSEEQLQMAQQKLSHNQSFASRNNKVNTYLLRALVSCGECQRACVAVTRQRKYKYYICSGKDGRHHPEIEERCTSRFIPVEQLDELVWADLREALTHPESIRQALERAHGGHWLPQELQARRENLRKGRTSLGRQLERLTEAYLGGVIPLAEYERRRCDLEHNDRALESQERQLETQSDKHVELAGLMGSIEDFCRRVAGGLDSVTFEQKRELVELLIDRVIVIDGEVEIRYVVPTNPHSERVRFCHLRTDYFGHPGLIEAIEHKLGQQVRVSPVRVIGVRRSHKSASQLT